MSDPFNSHMSGLESPASNAFDIAPADGANLATVTRALYVGGSGDVAVTLKSGTSVVLHGVVAGTILPMRIVAVAQTDTTATNLVGLC